MRLQTQLTVVDSIKAVIEDNLKEDKDQFIERTAVTLKKDFFHELYKELSYDVHDSSEKSENEKKTQHVLIDFIETFKPLILGKESWVSEELLGTELWSHLTTPAKGKTTRGRMRQFKTYKKDTIVELISVIRNLQLHFEEQPLRIRKILLNSKCPDDDMSLSSANSLTKYFNFWEKKFPSFLENLYTVFSMLKLSSLKTFYGKMDNDEELNDINAPVNSKNYNEKFHSDDSGIESSQSLEDIHSIDSFHSSSTDSFQPAQLDSLIHKFEKSLKALHTEEEHPSDFQEQFDIWKAKIRQNCFSPSKMEERNRPRNIIPQVAIQRYEQTRQGNRLTDEGTLSENKSLAVGHGCYLSFEKNRLMMLADSHPLIYFVRHDNQVIGNSSIDVGFKNTVALFPDDNQLELIFKNAAKPNEGPIQIFITKNQ